MGQPFDRILDPFEDSPDCCSADALDVAQPFSDVDDDDIDGVFRRVQAPFCSLLFLPSKDASTGGADRENGEENGGDGGESLPHPRAPA
jgi:hypothetical protein